jgi:hypothetical protein
MTKEELAKKTDIIWRSEEERIFRDKKSNAHEIFKYLAASPSCNDIGLSSFIQQLLHRNRTGEMRVCIC